MQTLIPDEISVKIPHLYEQDGNSDPTVFAHIYSTSGDWYITELDKEEEIAFGWVRLAAMPECAELGYFSITELDQMAEMFKQNPIKHWRLLIELDLHWQPKPLSQVKNQ